MACEFEGRIERSALGELDADERLALREHVAGCAPCAARLEEATYMEQLLVGAFREVGDRVRSPRAGVLAAIEAGRVAAPRRADSGRARAPGRAPPVARSILRVVMTAAVAAGLIATAALGLVYRTMLEWHRDTLLTQTRVELRNLAIVLRPRLAAPHGDDNAELRAALGRLGIGRDPFGGEYVLVADAAGVRVRAGSDDDLVAWVAR